MKPNSRTYLRHMIGTLVGVLSLVVMLNILVDPYALFGTPSVKDLTERKYFVNPYERTIKPILAVRLRPKTIVLGSSRTNVGIDPALLASPGAPAFNLSVNGANARELRTLFEGAVKAFQPKLAIIGLDYFAFTSQGRNDTADIDKAFSTAFGTRLGLYVRYALSLKSLQDCILTLFENRLRRPPSHDERGMYVGYDPDRVPFSELPPGGTLAPLEAAFAEFALILDLARSRGVALRLFVSPTYNSHRSRDGHFLAWLDRISSLAAERHFGVVDFSADAELTGTRGNFLDVNHYRPHVGARIVARLLGSDLDAAR